MEDLRQREFTAGRYNPVMLFIEFPITDDSPSPEANHESIDELCEDIERGTARHIIIYDRDRPIEVFFIGCSFD